MAERTSEARITLARPESEKPISVGATSTLPTYAWWIVAGLVGLDCFSTLAYLPTIAVTGAGGLDGAGGMAPLAAIAVSILLVGVALPIYLYIVGRSPHGRGATGLLEKCFPGWAGKVLVLFLLGYVATDIVMTRTVSLAAASKHILVSPFVHKGMDWVEERKDAIEAALPEKLQGETTDRIFDWWDEQLVSTVCWFLMFALYFYLLRGFTRRFVYTAVGITGIFLLLNGLVIGSGLIYLARHPEYLTNRKELIFFGTPDPLDFVRLAVVFLPPLALGLSGFELSMASAPLVRGKSEDNPMQPRGRIRNARKMLIAVAVLMGLLVASSVSVVSFLVPSGAMEKNGLARHRALAYLAHGGSLQLPGQRVGTDNPSGQKADDENEPEDAAPVPLPAVKPPEAKNEPHEPRIVALTGSELNPLFGENFGMLYDFSTVLILCWAGACVTVSLRELLPQYLTRYGMEMRWAHHVGVLLSLFNLLILVVVIAMRASISEQAGLYSTSVLVLLAGAALAAGFDLSKRRSIFGLLIAIPLMFACVGFLIMAGYIVYKNPTGAAIPLLIIVPVLVLAALSRWFRSTELRFDGFVFADEESGIRWEQIRRMEFQVLVPYRSGAETLAEKEMAIRAAHRLTADVPIIFIDAELGDPSDFQQQPLMQISKEDGQEVIRVSQCASIAHVLAAIALEFREVGLPPEVHFAWSSESPLASNLNFLLWGEGNIPWMVHALIRRAERDPVRQPRVVIG